MSVEKKINKKNNELQQKIILEIEKIEKGESKRNLQQLQTILKELQNSNKVNNMTLSYPRIIVDSWSYTDQLGIELIELAELYKKV